MLSKRTNDIIFIAIIVVVAVGMIFMRFTLINQIDDRIDRTRSQNETLVFEIASLTGDINRYRDSAAPSQVELYQVTPRSFNRNQLSLFITAEAFRAGITNEAEFNRSINVLTTRATPLENSPHHALLSHFDLYIVTITYQSDTLDELHTLLDLLDDAEQLFLIRSIDYNLSPTHDRIPITLTFYAVYARSAGTS